MVEGVRDQALILRRHQLGIQRRRGDAVKAELLRGNVLAGMRNRIYLAFGGFRSASTPTCISESNRPHLQKDNPLYYPEKDEGFDFLLEGTLKNPN